MTNKKSFMKPILNTKQQNRLKTETKFSNRFDSLFMYYKNNILNLRIKIKIF
jgi:hypothetical protein